MKPCGSDFLCPSKQQCGSCSHRYFDPSGILIGSPLPLPAGPVCYHPGSAHPCPASCAGGRGRTRIPRTTPGPRNRWTAEGMVHRTGETRKPFIGPALISAVPISRGRCAAPNISADEPCWLTTWVWEKPSRPSLPLLCSGNCATSAGCWSSARLLSNTSGAREIRRFTSLPVIVVEGNLKARRQLYREPTFFSVLNYENSATRPARDRTSSS